MPDPTYQTMPEWPTSGEDLEREQRRLAALADTEPAWCPSTSGPLVGGVFATLPTGAANREVIPGDPAWAAAVTLEGRATVATAMIRGRVGAAYRPGYLALQFGPLMAAAVRALDPRPEVLLVAATGRDHPRRAGLALHLGAVLDLPTIGVTDRPLAASGAEPSVRRRSASPLLLGADVVGHLVRTRWGVHPIAVHAAWRTDPETALAVVLSVTGKARTPEPIRRARRLARTARARDEGRLDPGDGLG
jgi:deoxyribonuclease V